MLNQCLTSSFLPSSSPSTRLTETYVYVFPAAAVIRCRLTRPIERASAAAMFVSISVRRRLSAAVDAALLSASFLPPDNAAGSRRLWPT